MPREFNPPRVGTHPKRLVTLDLPFGVYKLLLSYTDLLRLGVVKLPLLLESFGVNIVKFCSAPLHRHRLKTKPKQHTSTNMYCVFDDIVANTIGPQIIVAKSV